jgi:Uncharacterized protein conserved in bacteria (DUF2188)
VAEFGYLLRRRPTVRHSSKCVWLFNGEDMSDERIYVERRDQGDYAVRRANSERASAVEPTQARAIARAREINPGVAPHVERVRNTTRGTRDHWRKP